MLLNNDIEVKSEKWMEEMLSYCQREDVGIVGAKLLYPNEKIQHAGDYWDGTVPHSRAYFL